MPKGKMIPCRVCGKQFEPCSYCQSHSDVFRWRNFACSIECAKKYVNAAEKYREEERKKAEKALSPITESKTEEPVHVDKVVEVAKKKSDKKKAADTSQINEGLEI